MSRTKNYTPFILGITSALGIRRQHQETSSFPPSIRLVRPHTLGRGDAVCDFQYCRVEKP